MPESLFADCPELDVSFLEEAYAGDLETASMVFQQYLAELPSNLSLITKSFKDNDIESFQKHIHKQKPSFSYVGLTHITNKLHELQSKCQVTPDLTIYRSEIEEVLHKIALSAHTIEKVLARMQEQDHP